MACKSICKLCDKLIISNSVSVAGDGNIIVNIPAGSYLNCEKYCLVIAQAIPATATINAPVFISIGTGGTAYELVTKDGVQVVASQLRSRTKYSTNVVTTPSGGVFKLIGDLCCKPTTLTAINGS
ncbi:MAG: hypothetical protein KBT03_04705 [Bacteroidales bacterium]|nr:hypothetical protein [Candidatus Scybalousia scybalohippi]